MGFFFLVSLMKPEFLLGFFLNRNLVEPPGRHRHALWAVAMVGCHGYLHELGRHEPEASLLEASDDLATQASLDAVGLHGDEGALHVCWGETNSSHYVSPVHTHFRLMTKA